MERKRQTKTSFWEFVENLSPKVAGSNGICVDREQGTPQGGPLSPLLANLLLDDLVACEPGQERGGVRAGTQVPGPSPASRRAPGDCPQGLARAKQRVRQITRRSRGVSMTQVIDELNTFLTGWVTYFRHAECRTALREMDGWVRRKLRCLCLKQCRFMQPIANWLQKLGVPRRRAWLLAQSGKGWWRLSCSPPATKGMSLAWLDSLGVLSLTQRYAQLNR